MVDGFERLSMSPMTPEDASEFLGLSPESMMELMEQDKIHFPWTRKEDGRKITGLSLLQIEAEQAGLFEFPDTPFQDEADS